MSSNTLNTEPGGVSHDEEDLRCAEVMSFVFPSLSDMAVGFIALLTLAWTFSVGAASQNETAGAGKVVCVFNLLLLLVTETKTLQPCHSFFKSRSPLMPNYIYPLCVCVCVPMQVYV